MLLSSSPSTRVAAVRDDEHITNDGHGGMDDDMNNPILLARYRARVDNDPSQRIYRRGLEHVRINLTVRTFDSDKRSITLRVRISIIILCHHITRP